MEILIDSGFGRVGDIAAALALGRQGGADRARSPVWAAAADEACMRHRIDIFARRLCMTTQLRGARGTAIRAAVAQAPHRQPQPGQAITHFAHVEHRRLVGPVCAPVRISALVTSGDSWRSSAIGASRTDHRHRMVRSV
jgi:hypothetical protein